MIFLTVGTQFPFDRLMKAVDETAGNNGFDKKIFAQIGEGQYKPQNFEYTASLEKSKFDNLIRQSSGVISHAGMGTITMALKYDKPLLVMPRLAKYGEVVNDHQIAIARKFEEFGHILVAYDVTELSEKIEQLKTFVPRKRHAQPRAVAERIAVFLNELTGNGN